MNNNDIFDTYGQDGLDNKKAWSRLPVQLKYFISSIQNLIMEKVKRNVLKKYGESAIKSLVKTSGFRSITTNSRVGGVSDSLHLFGCAIDFAKVGTFRTEPIPTCCDLQCLDSGDCWHVQLKRGTQNVSK